LHYATVVTKYYYKTALRNSGDEVLLQDKSGKEVDAVIYGESSYKGVGWQAEPLKKPREGICISRL